MVFRRCVAAALIFVVWAGFGLEAQAQPQPWPSRPVRIVAPYAAGGNSDVMARVVAQRLTEAFGHTFIVENRVGANGALAAEVVIRSPADGYTWDPTFSEHSYGFRPGRSAHQAVKQAQELIACGL